MKITVVNALFSTALGGEALINEAQRRGDVFLSRHMPAAPVC